MLFTKIKEHVDNLYWYIKIFFTRLIENIHRSFVWAKFGWEDRDWDYAYLYATMKFKAIRILIALENGSAKHKKEDIRALKEFIIICDRLTDYTYEDKYFKIHDKRWGKRKPIKFSEPDEKGMCTMIHEDRPKVKSKKDKKLERQEFLDCWTKADDDRKKDIDRMAEILKNHSVTWWD
jgi:hypothetical protein